MLARKLRIRILRLWFLLLIPVVIFVESSWIVGYETEIIVELSGYLLLLTGLLIRLWCILYIGGRKSKDLVMEGPYSICRNPLYVGTFLLAIGAGLCFENLLVLAFSIVIIIPAHLVVVRMEESQLETIFGEQYRLYKKQVPRYWPRRSGYKSRETVIVSVRSIRRIAMDTAGILLLPEIEDILELLHDHGVIPVLWHLF